MALTQQEKASLEAMSPEQLVWLLGKIREAKAMFSVKGCMPQSAMDDLMKAVPDKLCQEIVQDLRSGRSEPGWLKPTGAPPPERGSGWAKPLEHGSPSGLRYVDQLCDVQDALDKRELERRLRGG
jgi:hypothetical protein